MTLVCDTHLTEYDYKQENIRKYIFKERTKRIDRENIRKKYGYWMTLVNDTHLLEFH